MVAVKNYYQILRIIEITNGLSLWLVHFVVRLICLIETSLADIKKIYKYSFIISEKSNINLRPENPTVHRNVHVSLASCHQFPLSEVTRPDLYFMDFSSTCIIQKWKASFLMKCPKQFKAR